MKYKLLLLKLLIVMFILISNTQVGAQEVFENIIYNKSDDPFQWSPNMVNALFMHNGELIAGGRFKTLNGSNSINIAVYKQGSWIPIGQGINFSVNSIIEFRGELFIGGSQGVKKWDGNNWISVGGANNAQVFVDKDNLSMSVNTMCVFNNDLYVGGSIGPQGTIEVVLLKWDGNSWSSVDPRTKYYNDVISLEVYNNELYILGSRSWAKLGETKSDTIYPLLVWDGSKISRINIPNPPKSAKSFYLSNSDGTGKLLSYDGELFMTYEAGSDNSGIIKWNGMYFSDVYTSGRVNDFIFHNDKLYFTTNRYYVGKLNEVGSQFLNKFATPNQSKLIEFDGRIFVTIEESSNASNEILAKPKPNPSNNGVQSQNYTNNTNLWEKRSVTKFQMENPRTGSWEDIMFTNPGKYIEIRNDKDLRVQDLDILEMMVQAPVAGLYKAGQFTDGVPEAATAELTKRYRGNFVLLDNNNLPAKQGITVIDFFYDRNNKIGGLLYQSFLCKCKAQIFFTNYQEGLQILR